MHTVCRLLSILLCALSCTAPICACAQAAVPELGTFKQFDIPSNEGTDFVRRLGAGWNLGNTLDAIDDSFRGNDLDLEGYWCQVKTTREMIQTVHAAGFSSIRLPTSWHNHVNADFTINEAWMNRVQEIVDWCLDEGLYVILNTHHDEGEATFYPDSAHSASSERYLTAIWQQIADRFRDYDEHLIFESMNEPRLKGTSYEWYLDPSSEACVDSAKEIARLNQVFVDTIRAGGGSNETRFLMIPGYDASVDGALSEYYVLPTDTISDHLLVSVHAYTPYDFALNTSGTSSFSAQNQNDRSVVASFMNHLYNRFVANGIPVVIGEYGALDKNNLQDRVDFFAWYVASAACRGMPCLVWDNNAFHSRGENFGYLQRADLTWPFPEILEAIRTYSLKN